MANTTDISQFLIPNEVPFNFLECKKAFAGLTTKEKLYAHYLCRASWQGALICLLQTSPESPGIFLLFQKIFSAESVESFCAAAEQGESGLSDNEIKVCYCCHVTVSHVTLTLGSLSKWCFWQQMPTRNQVSCYRMMWWPVMSDGDNCLWLKSQCELWNFID